MALSDLSNPRAVIAAVEEFDQLGREAFLKRYGFKPARSYFLEHEGRFYDSKAIAGVAHGYQHGERLEGRDFVGGEATVRRKLEKLGFTIRKIDAANGRSGLDPGDTLLGPIDGVNIGDMFNDRRALYDRRVHRALQAGIVGRSKHGAESIVLSGGYVDDEDYGSIIIYTGDGGRDDKTKRQIADQEFTDKNQALVTSCLNGLPVRVVRGSAHRSPHSPSSGYRYDGLFRVERYWRQRGRDGYLVCRYELHATAEEALPTAPPDTKASGIGPAPRIPVTTLRIVRDTALSRRVKAMHDHTCQVCGTRLVCEGGPYAEAAHIRPLGTPHHGSDVAENILCLCPNHHVLFDNGGFTIETDLTLIGLRGQLRVVPGHNVGADYLGYHRAMWAKVPSKEETGSPE